MAKKEEKAPVVNDNASSSETVSTTVRMKRVLIGDQQGPTEADVHVNEVEAWRRHGWYLATE